MLIRKDVVLLVFCTTQWMQRHISYLEEKFREVFGGGQVVGRQKLAHHQEYCSGICMVFVSDLIAYSVGFILHECCSM